MTRKQIDAAREKRLWIRDVILPASAAAISLVSIPQVRETIAVKVEYIKLKTAYQAAKIKEQFDQMKK